MATPVDDSTARMINPVNDARTAQAQESETTQMAEEDAEVREACQQFEEIFLRILLKEARINQSLGSGEGAASKMYGDMTREALAKALTQAGGLGLADVLFQQLSRDNLSTGILRHYPEEQGLPGLTRTPGHSESDE